MINKAAILAGGTGARLWPLTKIQNKHLLPIYNDLMITYPLRTLINSGITDIMIVAGGGFAGDFLELLGSGEEFGVSLSYTVQERSSGIADALRLTKRFIGKENLVVILGDNIFEDKFDFSDFREGGRVYLKKVSDPQRFGVARLINWKNLFGFEKLNLVEIVEKPDITKVDNELIDKGGWGLRRNRIVCL